MTYAEVGALVEAAGAGLVAAGMRPQQKCSIYGANSPEWMVAMQVCEAARRGLSVPDP